METSTKAVIECVHCGHRLTQTDTLRDRDGFATCLDGGLHRAHKPVIVERVAS